MGDVCVTHTMGAVPRRDRPFPCYEHGQHADTCENPRCRGCLPRAATHGHLCVVCFERLEDALKRVGWLIAHLRSIEKPAQAIGERVDKSMERSILLPDTWIAADELMEALGYPVIPSTATIDDAIDLAHGAVAEWTRDIHAKVNTVEGATAGVLIPKRMGIALRRWPDSEPEFRKIPGVRCTSCHEVSLYRRAPQHFKDDIYVSCETRGCGYFRDWWEWKAIYEPVFEAWDKNMRRLEREKRAQRVSEGRDE